MDVTYSFPDKVLIDPFLLAAGNTAARTFIEIEENGTELEFYLPRTFYDYLIETDWVDGKPVSQELSPVVRYYLSGTNAANLNQVAGSLHENRERFSLFDASEYAEQYGELHQTLRTILPYRRERQVDDQERRYRESPDLLADAVFEELVFLSEMSGLISRIRRVITHAIEAGFVVIEASEEVFEEGINPRLKDGDQVKKDVCKELGNWVVTGLGISAVGMIGGPIAGAVSVPMVKWGTDLAFLLVIDPP